MSLFRFFLLINTMGLAILPFAKAKDLGEVDYCKKFIQQTDIAFNRTWHLEVAENAVNFIYDPKVNGNIHYSKDPDNSFTLRASGDAPKDLKKQLRVKISGNAVTFNECKLNDENKTDAECVVHTFEVLNGKCFPMDSRSLDIKTAYVPKFNLKYCAQVDYKSSSEEIVKMLQEIKARGTRTEDIGKDIDPLKWKTPLRERSDTLLKECVFAGFAEAVKDYKKELQQEKKAKPHVDKSSQGTK